MKTNNIMIKKLSRFPIQSLDDELEFKPGLNVIVGPPNTGKSKWLQMLDYLMGNHNKVEDALGEDIANKYESIKGVFIIGNKELVIERKWKDRGFKSKIIVNGEVISIDDFSNYLLNELNIPILHFPQGNPYSERHWPLLGWRSLLRHIYRQRRFWSDIADKQPDSEQHACLMLFLGIAEFLFSEEYGKLVGKRKRIFQLQSGKEQFLSMLDNVAEGLGWEDTVQSGITEISIDVSISKIESRITEFQAQKANLLNNLIKQTFDKNSENMLQNLEEKRRILNNEHEELSLKISTSIRRIEELSQYKTTLYNEISRILRTQSAGKILSALKVTNCPVCDQSIEHLPRHDGECYLCKQSWNTVDETDLLIESRIDFEKHQIQGEIDEIDELIVSINESQFKDIELRKSIIEKTRSIEEQIRPFRESFAGITSPDISIIDMEIGKLQEKMQQLDRFKSILDIRSRISEEIDNIEREINLLESEVKKQNSNIKFSQSADILVEGMTTYLTMINKNQQKYWTQGRIGIRLRERDYTITVNGEKWHTKLGGTLTLYFLIAYHYGLLTLYKNPKCHYPGLVILDLPATLEDGATVKDKENYILEPFVDLFQQPGMEGTQLIAAGAAFEDLKGAHRIEFTHVWE